MNDMIVKNVDVLGDEIMAARDSEGNVWAGVKWFCQGLGFSRGQINRQVKKIQTDSALNKGASNLVLPTNGGNQEVLCIKLDFVPLWLAKITITEKTRQNNPELSEKLLEYQLKAKDILAEAFAPNQSTLPMSTDDKIRLLAQGNVEIREELNSVRAEVEALKQELPLLATDCDTINRAVTDRVIELLGGADSEAFKDKRLYRALHKDIWTQTNREMGVRRYKDIRRSQMKGYLLALDIYLPPVAISKEIEKLNEPKPFTW